MNYETTKFTPGPWELRFNDIDCESEAPWWEWEIEGPNIEHIAECHQCGGNTRETELANARLIACAPELLEVLESIVLIHCHHECDYRFCDDPLAHCDGCDWLDYKQLIARAKGE